MYSTNVCWISMSSTEQILGLLNQPVSFNAKNSAHFLETRRDAPDSSVPNDGEFGHCDPVY